jgi:hypothetical protein
VQVNAAASRGCRSRQREDRDRWMHDVVAAVDGDDAQDIVHAETEEGLGSVDQSDDDDRIARGPAARDGREEQRRENELKDRSPSVSGQSVSGASGTIYLRAPDP